MKARATAAILLLAGLVTMSGCWDYRGMDDINIVAGIAIDRAEDGGYALTLEIVDVSAMKSGQGDETRSIYVTSNGATVFEAVRNAKKRLSNTLYFGSMRTVIISEEIARQDGLAGMMDSLLRDTEPRETLSIVISREESAEKLIKTTGLDATNVSFEMADILAEDMMVSATTLQVKLYQAYNMYKAPGISLVLPAFRIAENNGEQVVEVDGIAMFNGDKLVRFLSAEETHYFLIASQTLKGGAIILPLEASAGRMTSLEIFECKNRQTVTYENGKVMIKNEISLRLGIVDMENINEHVNVDAIQNIVDDTKRVVAERVGAVFETTQATPGGDIYGYGNKLYKNQLALWKQIEDDWEALYSDAELETQVIITVIDSGFITQ